MEKITIEIGKEEYDKKYKFISNFYQRKKFGNYIPGTSATGLEVAFSLAMKDNPRFIVWNFGDGHGYDEDNHWESLLAVHNTYTKITKDPIEGWVKAYNEKNDCTEDTEMFMPVSLHGPWIYLPGEPAIIDRQVAGEMGEEVNISRKLQDSFYQWVITIEKIYRTHDCSKNISHWRAHQIFTLLWLCSAHQFLKQGKMIRTVRCLWFALLRFLKGIFGRRRS